jgi:signal recognition particle GTPase
VNRLLKQFSDAKKMISQLSNNTFAKAGKKVKGQLPFKF